MLNNTLHKVSGCLRATPANHLPILAGIAPPTLRREAAVQALSGKAINNEDHPLHKIVTDLLHCARLKSRCPFAKHSHQLLHSSLEDVSKILWLKHRWLEEWQAAHPIQAAQFVWRCQTNYLARTCRVGNGQYSTVSELASAASPPL